MIPTSIDKIYKNAVADRSAAEQKVKSKRSFLRMDPANFKDILVTKMERIFLERNEPKKYEFDVNNKPIIQQLYFYAIGSEKFNGNLYKGIHLWGDYGTGKTTMLQAFCEIMQEYTGRRILMIMSKELGAKILDNGVDYYKTRPFFLDDIGREIKELKEWGNLCKPVPDLYYLRKETGAWTFQTCQKPIAELADLYGKFTTDRMKAMFNEIEFKGTSKRT